MSRAFTRWCLSGFLLAAALPGQGLRSVLETAKAQFDKGDYGPALVSLEDAMARGLDSWEAHFLRAHLLLASNRLEEAGRAAEAARKRVAADEAATAQLIERIGRASAGAAPPVSAGSAAAPTPEAPLGSPASTSEVEAKRAAAARKEDEFKADPGKTSLGHEAAVLYREAGETEKAAGVYGALARSADPGVSEPAKVQLVESAQQLVTEAETALEGSDPARAEQKFEAAFQQCAVLHGDLHDTDKAVQVGAMLARSKDVKTARRALLAMLNWADELVAAGEQALEGKAKETAQRCCAEVRTSTAAMHGRVSDDECLDLYLAMGKSGDAEARRLALVQFMAWCKQLVAEGEAALRENNRPRAEGKFRTAEAGSAALHGQFDEPEWAGEVARALGASSDAAVAQAALLRLAKWSRELIAKARKALQQTDQARYLAAAYFDDPSQAEIGLEAAVKYEEAQMRVEAVRLYRHLSGSADPGAVQSAAERLAAIHDWARREFELTKQQFDAAIGAGRAADAIAMVEEIFGIFDEARMESAKDAIAQGQTREVIEPLKEMAIRLQSGALVSARPGDGAAPAEPGSPPEPGQPFETSVGMPMLWIQEGDFWMGSPPEESRRHADEQRHSVKITRGFWIAKQRVSRQNWLDVMGTWHWLEMTDRTLADRTDADVISWDAAATYCIFLTRRERSAGRIPIGYSYVLPTEAEWEYASRAGRPTAYAFGNLAAERSEWTRLRKPNAWGLVGVHDAVWEWCLDACKTDGSVKTYVDGIVDPCNTEGDYRVCRGNGRLAQRHCRSTFAPPYESGFRPVLAPRVVD